MRDFSYQVEDCAQLSNCQMDWQSVLERMSREFEADGAHDVGHLRRVWSNFLKLSKGKESVCLLTGMAACYLHDCVQVPKNSSDRGSASRLAADRAVADLKRVEFPESLLNNVYHCIHAHSYSANIRAETLEAKLLSDADKLDALGKIGLARLFHTAGSIGSHLFNPDDPIPNSRKNLEKVFAVDHYYEKLRTLHKRMYTPEGIVEAKRRISEMDNFIHEMVS